MPRTNPVTVESPITGLRPYARVVLRHDVKNFMPWVMLISVLSVTSILAYIWIFPTIQSRTQLAATLGSNRALSLIFGVATDLTVTEAFNTWRALALGGFFSALMSTFIVVRYTRAEEDTGQGELFASGVMGRQTRLAAAVLVATVASVVLGVVSTLLTITFGASFVDTALLCATFTASALMFTGVAALGAQIFSDARAVHTFCVTLLGAMFVARGYFDASGAAQWTTWVTPLGWMQAVKPATDNNLWPFALAAVFTAVLLGAAFVINGRRDFGAGVIPFKQGPATGPARGGIFSFVARLNRGTAGAWLTGFTVLGVVFGYLTTSVGDLFASDPSIGKILASGVTDKDQLMIGFISTLLQLVGIIATVCGVQVVMRLEAEERAMRTDPLLATTVVRPKLLGSYATLAFGTAAGCYMLAVGIMSVVGAALGNGLNAGDVLRQGLVTLPAIMVVIALSLAVVGAKPQKKFVGWLGVVAVFALTIFGPMFNLWGWILSMSPFHHVPIVVNPNAPWTGWWILFAVWALFTAIAFKGFSRRDIL